jgi:shikimate kinase
VVFLSVELTDAVKRVGLGAGRPLLSVNPRATLKYLMEQRRPLYTEVARHTIATDRRTPDDIAAEVAGLLAAA